MNISELPVKCDCPTEKTSRLQIVNAPWQQLSARIRAALDTRNFYVASSEDLGVLWREEKIDAVERRRRIAVFAALNHWQVDARSDGRAARFQGPLRTPVPGELLSRNHE